MQKIVAHINLFSANQPIYGVSEEGIPQLLNMVPIDMIPDSIVGYCEKFDLNKAHIYGSEDFIEALVNKIHKINETKYSNRKLEIEVNA